MSRQERPSPEPSPERQRPEPLHPTPLTPELAEFLRGYDYAALLHGTENFGTVLIAKLPSSDIQTVHGPVPIHLGYQLFDHPAAPVVRLVTTIYDRPTKPLALETFINPADPDQRGDFAALGDQETFHILLYDERLRHRLSKRVTNGPQPEIAGILEKADFLLSRVLPEQFDYDAAKAAVMVAYPLT